jgi:hypothetical protein
VRDWVVLIACALIGWGLVSWLIAVVRPQGTANKEPPQGPLRLVNMGQPDASATAADMETAWPSILQVDRNATTVEIESAYHTLLAECDRVRFSTWYSAQERQEAEARRARVCAAYEFIRPRR